MSKPQSKLVDRRKTTSLSDQVTVMLDAYFNTLENEQATDVYEMVLQQVEKPLIEFVLKQTDNNQTHTANILGINRNTLKKKMQKYDLV
ncbi:MAG TPA: Fis family transcriptional regulator [Thiomicrospira sp.]|jgi:Fis family transcriptional regulator|nr:Fis family transcriptional regulator [Thiomicrospira sp.]